MTNLDRLEHAARQVGRPAGARMSADDAARVARLQAVQTEILTLGRNAAEQLRGQHAKLAEIDGRWDVAAAAKDKGRALEWSTFDEAVAKPAQRRMTELRAERDHLLAQLTAPHRQPGGHTEELQRQAAWARMQAALDGVGKVKTMPARGLLEDAARVGDTATLEAARRELPAYLQRHAEAMPPDLHLWLDVLAGDPATVEARRLEAAVAPRDLTAAELAVGQMARAAESRVMPDVLPYPAGEDGARVVAITESGEDVLTAGERRGGVGDVVIADSPEGLPR